MHYKSYTSRHLFRTLTTLSLVVCASVVVANAQEASIATPETGVVSGFVLTSDGASPLPQAIVSLSSITTSISGDGHDFYTFGSPRTTVTRADGGYHFADVYPARYRLEIRRIGYRPATLEVEMRLATVVNVSAVLEVTPVHLEQLEVRAASLDLFGRTSPVDEIGQRRIDIERWRQRAFLSCDVRALTHTDVLESVTLGTADPFRALQRLPGVTTRDDWTSEVWIRGANWGQTRVYFDGLPLFNPLHAGGVTSAINENALGSVLFHPGVRPLPLGEGAAGVVSMTSRPAGGTGDLRGYGDLALFGGGLTLERRFLDGRVGVLAGVRKSGLDFLTTQTELRHSQDEVMGFVLPDKYADAIARIDIGLGENTHIEASALWEHDWITDSLERGGPAFNDFSWGNAAGRVTLDIPLWGAYSRHTVAWSHFGLKVNQTEPRPSVSFYNWEQPTQIGSRGRVDQLTAMGEIGSVIPEEDDAGWRAGYQVTLNRSKYDGAPQSPHPFQVHVGPIEMNEKLVVVSGWGETRLKPTTKLTVQGGVRLDGTTSRLEGGRLHIAPQVSGRYAVSEQFSVSASLGRSYQYVQALAPAGLTVGPGLAVSHVWRLAGDSVPPLQSDVATIGAEYWLDDEWLGSANVYYRNSSGMTLVDPTPGPKQTRPSTVLGENDAKGLELSLRRIAGQVTMSVNYTVGLSEIEATGLQFPSPSDRRHSLDITSAWMVPRTFLGGAVRLVGAHTAASGAPYTRIHPGHYVCYYEQDYCDEYVPDILEMPNAARAPWYSALDLHAEWTKTYSSWRFAIHMQIRNLLNRDNGITYAVTRGGPCYRGTVDAPFCSADIDEFQPGVSRQGIFGLKIEF
ncbi:TonB-dependent receptor domain-containing protein [Gemmatimonadota bacterium]